jgi:hypothetical protein
MSDCHDGPKWNPRRASAHLLRIAADYTENATTDNSFSSVRESLIVIALKEPMVSRNRLTEIMYGVLGYDEETIAEECRCLVDDEPGLMIHQTIPDAELESMASLVQSGGAIKWNRWPRLRAVFKNTSPSNRIWLELVAFIDTVVTQYGWGTNTPQVTEALADAQCECDMLDMDRQQSIARITELQASNTKNVEKLRATQGMLRRVVNALLFGTPPLIPKDVLTNDEMYEVLRIDA